MKKILHLILFLLPLVSCTHQDKTDLENGSLWKIVSKSGTESYIFGTLHLYPENKITLSEEVIARVESSNKLVLESHMTNEEEHIRIATEIPDFLLKSFTIIRSEYGYGLVSMESQFTEIAKDSDVDIYGLESSEEVIKTMETVKKIPISDSIFIADEMLQDYKESLKLYQRESIQEFKETLIIQMGNEITQILVDNRNDAWLKKIISFIENDKIFIAVGIGHLGGEKEVLKLLVNQGYQVERIRI
ncbi:TraB/GumN family protein [Salegentibacter sp. F188]|uniref:TraB/GumN family protein n=1 Tax=Autumnicola patrickiae TaxID=3075591 RepID=A0ABU3DZK1_9FLAO|nr:TraB/GumN family protein [Salegentibacter sp. F188]MDT0689068.1 TraB/GumN family protein [Salegentibacter sp. F188]